MNTQIVTALEAEGPLTTRQLAKRLAADRSTVYGVCKRMERHGQLASRLVKGGSRVYFFPMTQEVMGPESYERIRNADSRLRTLIGRYSLPAQRSELIAALEKEFKWFLETGAVSSNQAAIEEFEEEVLEAVVGARKKGDVTSHLGVRPMHPAERLWALGAQLSLI